MKGKKMIPIRSKQHESNDIGLAIFHYAIAKHMVSRSIEKNDYGIDELIDVVDVNDFNGENLKILPGQMFAVQLKSSVRKSNSHILKSSTLNYLFHNNIPTFLVKVHIKTKKYSYANIRKQVRNNFALFSNNSSISLKLNSCKNYDDGNHILKLLKDRYLMRLGTSKDDLELCYLLCNASLLMEFNYELQREEMETDILLFLVKFNAHIKFLNASLNNSNYLGVIYKDIGSGAELILTYLKVNSGNFYRYQPQKSDSTLRSGLIYQELANMYLAIEELKSMFIIEKEYWYYKYGYRMDNIWPDELGNKFTSLFGNIERVVKHGKLVKLSLLLKEN